MLFDFLLKMQKKDWAAIWETSDIVIEGDEKAQQSIRFNIFQTQPNLFWQICTPQYRA